MAPPDASVWRISPGKSLSLDRPRVMAILNVTPDSFSDGGQHPTPTAVADAAARALGEGADLLDLGGESTRPGARAVDEAEQLRRILPALDAIRCHPARSGELAHIPITIDTTRAEVARRALDAGADAINDVSAGLDDPRMIPLAAERGVGLVLMHRLRPPQQDHYSDRYQAPPVYGDVVAEVGAWLAERAAAAIAAGVHRSAIVLDPGLGFGKTVAQNLELVARTGELAGLSYPILSGASRKSFVGRASGAADLAPRDRAAGSVAMSVLHFLSGARIFRVHDVAAQVQALRTAAAVWGVWRG